MLRIAIDIGGTFTDVVAETPTGFTSAKVLTTPKRPEKAALVGLSKVLADLAKSHSDITAIVHGTTLATNALIERQGAKTAFVTTKGFRDVLAMRYEKRFDQYALDITLPEPLVPRPLRLVLAERILADGSVLEAPQDEDIKAIAETINEQAVESVAVGFLHSYKNSSHEQYVAAALADLLDNSITICQSAEVACEIREYDRFSTVCANAYVRPLMSDYLDKLQKQLSAEGFSGSFLMMLSDGGLTSIDKARRFPIRLVEGGPAGGAALGAHVAKELGFDNTLALDIGGTTAKICFIENGQPNTSREFEIARSWRGMKGSGITVKVPTVELVEIGAGGGSIASTDTLGRLTIGPQSAGAEPGPACYNLGGSNATITDAHVVLGNLSAQGFAEGAITLEPQLARDSVKTEVQQPLGFNDIESAAAGIVEIADETMANAARVHGIELGLDVSKFALLVSGGGGGIHAARIAEKLGIQKVIVPGFAGVGSAVGFLRSPVAFEIPLSVVERLDELDTEQLSTMIVNGVERVRSIVAEAIVAEAMVEEAVVAETIADENIKTSVVAEVRYQGQGLEHKFSLNVDGSLSESLLQLEAQFVQRYESLFGFALPDIPVELVTVSIQAREIRPVDTQIPESPNDFTTQEESREIYDVISDRCLRYRVTHRHAVSQEVIEGPVVIPESQTTALVRPGWSVHAAAAGHLILQRESA